MKGVFHFGLVAACLDGAAARDFKQNDEIRIEFAGPNNTIADDGIRHVKYEIGGLEKGQISDFTKTIVVGEGESMSEESIKCSPQCDQDGLLAALVDEVDKPNAQNFLFIRSGSSKRIILKLRDGTKLGGPVLGALFENSENFLLNMKYQQIAVHPPAIRPILKSEIVVEEPDLEDSIFAMFDHSEM